MLLHKPQFAQTHAMKSFRNVGINKWNNLNENIRSSSTVSKFIAMYNKWIVNYAMRNIRPRLKCRSVVISE